jgi:hypothetical protein
MTIFAFDHRLFRLVPAAVLCAAGLTGCGMGERYVPVSGLVTLNGEPLGDAKLMFEPIGGDDGNGAGKPSYGRTDLNGRYSLECPIAKKTGAAVGEHRVRIVTLKAGGYTEEQIEAARKKLLAEEKAGGGSPDNVTDERIREYLSDTVQFTPTELLPPRYNSETELTFSVPSSGTDQANFELKMD